MNNLYFKVNLQGKGYCCFVAKSGVVSEVALNSESIDFSENLMSCKEKVESALNSNIGYTISVGAENEFQPAVVCVGFKFHDLVDETGRKGLFFLFAIEVRENEIIEKIVQVFSTIFNNFGPRSYESLKKVLQNVALGEEKSLAVYKLIVSFFSNSMGFSVPKNIHFPIISEIFHDCGNARLFAWVVIINAHLFNKCKRWTVWEDIQNSSFRTCTSLNMQGIRVGLSELLINYYNFFKIVTPKANGDDKSVNVELMQTKEIISSHFDDTRSGFCEKLAATEDKLLLCFSKAQKNIFMFLCGSVFIFAVLMIFILNQFININENINKIHVVLHNEILTLGAKYLKRDGNSNISGGSGADVPIPATTVNAKVEHNIHTIFDNILNQPLNNKGMCDNNNLIINKSPTMRQCFKYLYENNGEEAFYKSLIGDAHFTNDGLRQIQSKKMYQIFIQVMAGVLSESGEKIDVDGVLGKKTIGVIKNANCPNLNLDNIGGSDYKEIATQVLKNCASKLDK